MAKPMLKNTDILHRQTQPPTCVATSLLISQLQLTCPFGDTFDRKLRAAREQHAVEIAPHQARD
ncbi:hypothetical protein rosmuc_03630 [Roseovarius mucosus DSM 17069]|uniref:Uncharacterized protein n=1 Tax=Roseovarius mucosus DSM 17069 TaxID=1288298 RepID=A0A0A0HK06_9RHOB|nr:hypothetical protein rosmuc_03630 [Roseovarius mucosus DSM 17069]